MSEGDGVTDIQRLLQLARQQVAVLENGDLEGFQRLQAEREHAGPWTEPDPLGLDAEGRRRVVLVLEEVAHCDARAVALLHHLLLAVQTELSGLHRGRGALTGYRGGQHHRDPIALDRQA